MKLFKRLWHSKLPLKSLDSTKMPILNNWIVTNLTPKEAKQPPTKVKSSLPNLLSIIMGNSKPEYVKDLDLPQEKTNPTMYKQIMA